MTVLKELLDWSQARPRWQRDALRRLVLTGDLVEDDVHALAEICKSGHGLAPEVDVDPLTEEHVPERRAGSPPVALDSIFHHRGVNALAENQTLRFSRGLTLVYGDNAAGKTGYIRILKSACRARGSEQILGNVVAGTAPLSPVVSIKYRVGSEPKAREWSGEGEDEFISRVSVFDSRCAAVYLTEKTDVAFRPFGLDLFDKLVKACKDVRARLEEEQRQLASSTLAGLQPEVPSETAVARLLASVTSLTEPEAVRALSRLSLEEERRLAFLERSLVDLRAKEPEKLIQQLTLRAGRVQGLIRHLEHLAAVLSEQAVTRVFEVRAEGRRKREEARRLRQATFGPGALAGTGSGEWQALWNSARRFSQEHAYPGQEFPVVEDTARCVLCQQRLDHAAGKRLLHFENFVSSTTERELHQLREDFGRLRRRFTDQAIKTEAIDETLKELRIEQAALADAIGAALATFEDRLKEVVASLTEDRDLALDLPAPPSLTGEVQALGEQIAQRVRTLRRSATVERRKSMASEARELRARVFLRQHEDAVLAEIERRKKYAAYGLCIDETRTHSITQKNTVVTREIVSQRLKESFQEELARLGFHQIDVELTEVGGAEGVLYHRLVLTRAPGVVLPSVVSESEQRCLSIAAFFAELSTADDPSAIVFDDPVSSLDYKWREGVARRLVLEAKTRQVVVFTHDVVFLLLLKQFAKESSVEQRDQHVRHLPMGAGVCLDELPWVAMPVKRKIGQLKNDWQAAEKLFRAGEHAAYEKEAQFLYGLLRESWERALEEVLLEGVVERYRPGVQTQQIRKIADTTEDDCRALDTAMAKCSRLLPGHDQAAAARAPVPEPAELKADIDSLQDWVAAIRNRRR